VTLTVPTCRLNVGFARTLACVETVGSSVTMNNEEGQSLVVMWLRTSTVAMQSWLAKLTAAPHMC